MFDEKETDVAAGDLNEHVGLEEVPLVTKVCMGDVAF